MKTILAGIAVACLAQSDVAVDLPAQYPTNLGLSVVADKRRLIVPYQHDRVKA
jgi:hypothetical protein